MKKSPNTDTEFSTEQLLRYGRHIIMPEVGPEGQRKLQRARVLIAGMGGLGSPAAYYLAAAGVGTLGIVDFDKVEVSNLQRQILFDENAVGSPKTLAARTKLTNLNSGVHVEAHNIKLDSANALNILKEYDVIIDGTDRFASRYLMNDACVLLGKPNVYGSVYKFEGHVSVFDAQRGPCYRCLHPEPPPPELAPNCAEGGVLGVLPGIIGTMQAAEAIKLILGIGEPLIGRVLMIDALRLKTREMLLKKDPQCVVCGEHPSVTSLIDYEEFCSGKKDMPNETISVEELHEKMTKGEPIVLLDVRQPFEYQIANLNGLLIPLNELSNRMDELDASKEIVVYCHTGRRSGLAVSQLRSSGFTKARNLVGGIDAWSVKIDKNVPRY